MSSNLLSSLLSSAGSLQVYDRVFDTIQNNITNANTPCYAKEDQSLVSLPFNPLATGLTGGVEAGPLLKYPLELSPNRPFGISKKRSARNRRPAIFPPSRLYSTPRGTSGVRRWGSLALFNSFSQLSVTPNDSVNRQNVLVAADQVAQAFNQNATGIQSASSNADSQTTSAVSNINQLASRRSPRSTRVCSPIHRGRKNTPDLRRSITCVARKPVAGG